MSSSHFEHLFIQFFFILLLLCIFIHIAFKTFSSCCVCVSAIWNWYFISYHNIGLERRPLLYFDALSCFRTHSLIPSTVSILYLFTCAAMRFRSNAYYSIDMDNCIHACNTHTHAHLHNHKINKWWKCDAPNACSWNVRHIRHFARHYSMRLYRWQPKILLFSSWKKRLQKIHTHNKYVKCNRNEE